MSAERDETTTRREMDPDPRPNGAPAAAEPGKAVTVVVRRRVKPDRHESYEAWLSALIEDASAMPGYLGAQVQRPDQGDEYVSVFRFASVEELRAFEESGARRRALASVGELVQSDARWERVTGLEVWFTAPPGTVVPQPSRFRMALLLIAVVYGLVLSIGQLVGLVLVGVPSWLRLLVTITVEVFLMTYVLMPWLTRHLARFIYPEK